MIIVVVRQLLKTKEKEAAMDVTGKGSI